MTGSEERPRNVFFDAVRRKSVTDDVTTALPRGLRVATAYSWRFLVIAAAIGVAIWLVIQLKLLVIPLLIAILVSALLWPVFGFMLRHRFPRWLAIVISLIGTIAVVGGLLWLAIWQITRQWSSVQASTVAAADRLRGYLIAGPLNLTGEQIDGFLEQGVDLLEQQVQLLWTGALAIGSTVGHVATGTLLAVFILLCFLADGAGIWRWTVRLFPERARAAVDGAGRAGWVTVVNYARTQLLVATIDAVGIGLGAFLLGVPLAIPIAVLVFLGAFVPFVGAVVTGALAVFLALVYNGPWIALWMLVVVLGVQQLESHVLQPLLMGSAVKVHPLAVVLVVAGGAMVGGIPGALFAVPLAAFVNVSWIYLSRRGWETGAPPRPDDLIWSTVPRDWRTPA
ncbi:MULTISPECIES: AI-2E family transporter [unclassified Microbacterium]|uniref:AI-2E family transporter n=1 Tax=unclassified Microbacterium TaxID=2609290 RepID=UPI00214A8ED3|nr:MULTISPECIES: AI-2E family transporter [unclassified Microbacterium]MCR2784355.1 AI-2E family transporter [Microbacterium sp. zg.B96]MDL5350737.1 AI-2E family transporter [Microbacterium sp. zg-YB36]WIM14822.1 AI-2E family transporter [Microbacterium sp. zg-B96]